MYNNDKHFQIKCPYNVKEGTTQKPTLRYFLLYKKRWGWDFGLVGWAIALLV